MPKAGAPKSGKAKEEAEDDDVDAMFVRVSLVVVDDGMPPNFVRAEGRKAETRIREFVMASKKSKIPKRRGGIVLECVRVRR